MVTWSINHCCEDKSRPIGMQAKNIMEERPETAINREFESP